MAKRKKQAEGKDGNQPTDAVMREAGGRRLVLGDTTIYAFGWLAPILRTPVQLAAEAKAEAEMPRFEPPRRKKEPKQALLFELWKHPDVVAANGRPFTGIFQKTGSCVGAGGGNCWMTLACVEAVRVGDPEMPLIPFWLLPYGRSRYYLGDRSPGEGSSGGTFAKAATEDGTVPANSAGLPQPVEDDGMLTWNRGAEMAWSDGDAKQTMDLLSASRKHLVKSTAKCGSHTDVKAALQSGFPCTGASMYAHNGGKVQSDPPVLLGGKSGSWSHQMSILGWMEHPKLGDLFWLMNQWGASAHGKCPSGAPNGGVWITAKDCDFICRDEVFAFSQFEGFPSQDWDIPGIFA